MGLDMDRIIRISISKQNTLPKMISSALTFSPPATSQMYFPADSIKALNERSYCPRIVVLMLKSSLKPGDILEPV